MTANETVLNCLNQLCTELGTTPDAIYSKESQAWYFTKGSASIEVFITSYDAGNNTIRTFVRCFSPIHPIPTDPQQQLDMFGGALEANTKYMGVKISSIMDKGYVYAVAERDVEGMDFAEFKTLVNDVAYWADYLDDFLAAHFGTAKPAII